ncbi:hypothetical protein TRFO_13438 [Tritrichomonas foetus]|uniref:Uncharacterized protein n=1 Tax=Tritrichomonas foetus TaxID=1144522 RepID=A0A1J4KXZ1_9EUKA|nr:hypothetical protein TRFO_13438 [Tritrichomonas foetus]|eukprot:OHT16115.1 hypothetical protein TRFO_13438 [Tritrichomonas foetus]
MTFINSSIFPMTEYSQDNSLLDSEKSDVLSFEESEPSNPEFTPHETDDLFNRALDMINRLSDVCAMAANIDPTTVSGAIDFLNDPSSFDFFIHRIKTGIEMQRVKSNEEVRKNENNANNENYNRRLTREADLVVNQVQKQIQSLKSTIHKDHTQLMHALLPDTSSDSLFLNE